MFRTHPCGNSEPHDRHWKSIVDSQGHGYAGFECAGVQEQAPAEPQPADDPRLTELAAVIREHNRGRGPYPGDLGIARVVLAWVDAHTVPRAEVDDLRAQVEEMRRYERDNHHNARLCPYCEPDEATRDAYREANSDVYVHLTGGHQ